MPQFNRQHFLRRLQRDASWCEETSSNTHPEILNQLLRKEAFESGDVKLGLWNKFVMNYEKSFVNRCELIGIEMFDKFREEEEYKQSCLRAIKLNISRNEIVDIFESVVPKYVAMEISSYHRHPIDEFIGKDKLKEKESKLSIAIIRSHSHKRHNERDLPFDVYEWKRKDNVDEINYKLSNDCRLRLFYPFTHRTEGIYTKQEIKDIAERNSIKLSMNWKKDKMIEEFYKRSN